MTSIELVMTGIGILSWALVCRVLWATREGILWTLKTAVLGAFVFIAAQLILLGMQRSRREAVIGSYLASALAMATRPKRSRYVRSRVRKGVLDRDLKGERYDSRKHHIDHIWPHSRGGSNSKDNLRVISKAENLKKAARKPSLRDWL